MRFDRILVHPDACELFSLTAQLLAAGRTFSIRPQRLASMVAKSQALLVPAGSARSAATLEMGQRKRPQFACIGGFTGIIIARHLAQTGHPPPLLPTKVLGPSQTARTIAQEALTLVMSARWRERPELLAALARHLDPADRKDIFQSQRMPSRAAIARAAGLTPARLPAYITPLAEPSILAAIRRDLP